LKKNQGKTTIFARFSNDQSTMNMENLIEIQKTRSFISEDHSLNLGNAGYAGRNRANQLLLSKNLEGIILLGVKLNERNTLNWHPDLFRSSRSIIHVDYENSNKTFEDNKNIKRVIKSSTAVVQQLARKTRISSKMMLTTRRKWIEATNERFIEYPIPKHKIDNTTIEPGKVIYELRNILPANTSLFVDSGQHRLFPGFYWKFPVHGKFFTSAIIASTGWAIGAAVGAKIGDPDIPVVVITGDSCMRMHGLEIQTAVREQVSILYYVFNNKSLGSVYQRMINVNNRAEGLVNNYENDWKKFAESMNAYGARVNKLDELIHETREALNQTDKPTIIDVDVKFPSYIPDLEFSKSAFA